MDSSPVIGWNMKDMCEELGTTQPKIVRAMKYLGINSQREKLSTEEYQRIRMCLYSLGAQRHTLPGVTRS